MPNFHELPTTLWATLRDSDPPRLVGHPRVPAYRVGEPLRAGRDRWPEGAWYGFGPEGHELILFTSRITPRLIDNVRRGETEFALTVQGPVLRLAHRFGEDGEWGDVPFVWHLQPRDHRAVPAAARPGQRALLWVTLVGAEDGLIHAQRGVALGPELTHALHEAIRAQAYALFDSLDCVLSNLEFLDERPNAGSWPQKAAVRAAGNS